MFRKRNSVGHQCSSRQENNGYRNQDVNANHLEMTGLLPRPFKVTYNMGALIKVTLVESK